MSPNYFCRENIAYSVLPLLWKLSHVSISSSSSNVKATHQNKSVRTPTANSLLSLSNFSPDYFSQIVLILGAIAVMLPI